jgi:leucyl-tRNA synthetase
MRDLGLVEFDEPATRLFCQGTVLKGGTAMSKSKGNVVAAMEMAEKYGCDTARLYTLFAAPPEKDMEWSEQGVEGCSRFLHRVYRLFARHAPQVARLAPASAAPAALTEKEKHLLRKTHQTLKRVTHDLESRWHFNTSVAALMELANTLQEHEPLEENAAPAVRKHVLELFTLMLAPMAPHLAEEMWQMLGHPSGAWRQPWPACNEDLAREEEFEVVVQVNGKVRGKILVEGGLSEAEVVARALDDPKIASYLDGKSVRKKVVVPNKLVNFVIAD